MLNMNKIRKSLNQAVGGKVSAIVIVIVALAIPIYGFRDANFQKVELSIFSVLLPVFYVVAVGGFMYLALGKKGPNVTSNETDRRIATAYAQIQKKLTPILWLLFIGWLMWVAYLLWSLVEKG